MCLLISVSGPLFRSILVMFPGLGWRLFGWFRIERCLASDSGPRSGRLCTKVGTQRFGKVCWAFSFSDQSCLHSTLRCETLSLICNAGTLKGFCSLDKSYYLQGLNDWFINVLKLVLKRPTFPCKRESELPIKVRRPEEVWLQKSLSQ